jgi:hypothetical protein
MLDPNQERDDQRLREKSERKRDLREMRSRERGWEKLREKRVIDQGNEWVILYANGRSRLLHLDLI